MTLLVLTHRLDGAHIRVGRGHRGHAGHAAAHGLGAQQIAVAARTRAVRRVDNYRDLAVGDQVADVGTLAVVRAADLLHDLAGHVAAAQHACRTLGGTNVKAQVAQDARNRKDMTLVAVAHADEHLAAARIGQLVVDRQLRLGVCLGIALGDTHDLAGRLHLGPQDNVGTGETTPGHNGFLHAEPIELTLVARQAQARNGVTGHDTCRALGQRHAGGLGDKRHGTARARVGLDHVDSLALDGVLHVDQTAHAQRHRDAARGLAKLRLQALAKAERRDAGRGVAGVNTSLLDMLQNTADVHLFAVAQGVDIRLDRSLQEAVQVHRVVGADACSLGHVIAQMLGIVGDHHAAAAQHVARTHQQRVADVRGHSLGLLKRGGLTRRRVHDAQFVEQGGKALAVLGKIDGVGLCAHNVYAALLEHARQLKRGLAAKRHHDAVGALDIDDIHDVLIGERLKVQAVRGVVVGRDGLGVAVDHDSLKAAGRQRVARMYAAVVELDALANAVGAGAQDHGLGLARRRGLVGGNALLGIRARAVDVLVGLVVVLRGARELGGAGIDRLHAGNHAQTLAVGTHKALVRASQRGNLGVARAVLLEQAHRVGVDILHAQTTDALLDLHHVVDTVEVPRVDTADGVDARDVPATAQGLDHKEDATLGRRCHGLSELIVAQLVGTLLATGANALMPVLQRTHGLAEGLLKGAADRHDLAHGLHARGERGVGTLELLEGKARHLDDTVVDRGLKAGGRGLGDVVDDLVERVAHGQARGGLGDGEARGLGGKRGRTAHARVHLDDDQATGVGVHGKLHVGTAGLDANLLQNGKRGHTHALILKVGERLRRRHGDRVAGVHAHGVEVLDGAHDDAVASVVAHDLHLVLFPALDGLLDQHLVCGRELQALAHDGDELLVGMRDAAAGTAEGKARAQHAGVTHALGDGLGVRHAVGIARARDLQADLGHGLVKEFAVLAALDSGQVAADHLDAVLVERAVLCQFNSGVKTGLATQRGQQRVRMLFLDHTLDKLGGDGLDIGAVGKTRVGHDGRRVGVDQDDLKAILLEHLASLGARVVELAGLTNNDGPRTDDEDTLDVSTFRHI